MFGIVNVVTKRAKDYSGAAGDRRVDAAPQHSRRRRAPAPNSSSSARPRRSRLSSSTSSKKVRTCSSSAEDTGIDRFTGQPGRHSRAGRCRRHLGRAARDSLAPTSIARPASCALVRGNTELHLQGVVLSTRIALDHRRLRRRRRGRARNPRHRGLKHRFVVSTLLEVSARAYANYYSTRSDFIASRGELCPFGNVTCDYRSAGTAHWLGLELQSSWDWFRDSRFVTMVGVDGRQRGVSTEQRCVRRQHGPLVLPRPARAGSLRRHACRLRRADLARPDQSVRAQRRSSSRFGSALSPPW